MASDPLSFGNRKCVSTASAGSRRPDEGRRAARGRQSACRGSSCCSGSHSRLNSRNASISSGPNIFGKQRAARLSVAVLARDRSAMRDHDLRRAIDELAELEDARLGFEIEVDPHVHAAVAEVAVERTVVAVFAASALKSSAGRTQAVGRHRRVLPAFPPVRLTRLDRDGAQRGFAHVPRLRRLLRRADDEVRTRMQRREPGAEPLRACASASSLVQAPNSTSNVPLPSGRTFSSSRRMPLRAQRVGDGIVEAFEADGFVREDLGHVVGCNEGVGKGDADQTPKRRACREPERRLEHGRTRAFAADERTRDVKAVFRQELVQVVAGHAARNARKPLADERREPIANRFQPRIDLPPSARRRR